MIEDGSVFEEPQISVEVDDVNRNNRIFLVLLADSDVLISQNIVAVKI